MGWTGCVGNVIFAELLDEAVALTIVEVEDWVVTDAVEWTIFSSIGAPDDSLRGCDSCSRNFTNAWANPSLL